MQVTQATSRLAHTFIEVAGCRTSCWRGGEGRPLLFLHGSQGVPHPLPFMETFASRFDVIAPEHPGFGESGTPPWLKTIHDLAYFYLDFLEALGLKRVHVVGQALGGWIAAEMTVRCTARISSLVLAGAPGLQLPNARTLDVFGMSNADVAENLFHDPELARDAREHASRSDTHPTAGKNRDTLALVASDPHFHDPSLHQWLHRIDVPTLIVWGAQDKAVPPAIGDAYASLIPGARMVRLQRCGHLPHIEQAEQYVRLLTDFFNQPRRNA